MVIFLYNLYILCLDVTLLGPSLNGHIQNSHIINRLHYKEVPMDTEQAV